MCGYVVRGINETVISRVRVYEREVARYFARPASSMVKLRGNRCDFGRWEGRKFQTFRCERPGKYSREGTFITPESVTTYAKKR